MKILEYNPITGHFTRAGKRVGSRMKIGYREITVRSKKFYEHRLAFLFMTGEIPKMVDHVNGIKDDNRWCNLRASTKAQNNANRLSHKEWKGVHWNHTGFCALITVNKKSLWLGQYETAEEAHLAYCFAAQLYFGDFANGLNVTDPAPVRSKKHRDEMRDVVFDNPGS